MKKNALVLFLVLLIAAFGVYGGDDCPVCEDKEATPQGASAIPAIPAFCAINLPACASATAATCYFAYKTLKDGVKQIVKVCDLSLGDEELCDSPPPGSKPIDDTEWSGDHGAIKRGIGAEPPDNVKIDPSGHVWLEMPDGCWEDFGPAGAFTGSGKPRRRKGKG